MGSMRSRQPPHDATGRRAPRRPTIDDVARLASVAPSTVSRSLQGDPQISARTRERVRDVARQLGYVPNEAARSLVLKHTSIVALVLPDIVDPIHAEVATGFEQVTTDHAHKMIVTCSDHDPAREWGAIESIVAHRAAGIALFSSVVRHEDVVRLAGPTPCVFISPQNLAYAQGPGTQPPGTIRIDDAMGMRQIVDHLVERGYRRIAYAPGPDLASNVARRDPLVEAVRRAGLAELVIAEPADDWRDPVRTARSIRRIGPDAVVCYDDKLALGLMRALRKAGTDVPAGLAIVGFDGIPFVDLVHPRLTTVAQPAAELGRRAAEALFASMDGGEPAPATMLPVKLVIGDTTPPRT